MLTFAKKVGQCVAIGCSMCFAEKKYVVSGRGRAGFVLMSSHISSLDTAYPVLNIVKIRSDVGGFGSVDRTDLHNNGVNGQTGEEMELIGCQIVRRLPPSNHC